MSEADYQMLVEQFALLERNCTTPEQATQQLRREGILDENGNLAAPYRDSAEYRV